MYNYNAPCPFGSGNNTYYFTLYALSDDLQSTVETKKETKEKFDVGLKMILYAFKKGMILGSAQLAVSFCMYSDEKVRGSVHCWWEDVALTFAKPRSVLPSRRRARRRSRAGSSRSP
jgi:hypothetical protein